MIWSLQLTRNSWVEHSWKHQIGSLETPDGVVLFPVWALAIQSYTCSIATVSFTQVTKSLLYQVYCLLCAKQTIQAMAFFHKLSLLGDFANSSLVLPMLSAFHFCWLFVYLRTSCVGKRFRKVAVRLTTLKLLNGICWCLDRDCNAINCDKWCSFVCTLSATCMVPRCWVASLPGSSSPR